ncbi:hypothetical protein Ancab_002893 [Ancistrocladus abbreviatus]
MIGNESSLWAMNRGGGRENWKSPVSGKDDIRPYRLQTNQTLHFSAYILPILLDNINDENTFQFTFLRLNSFTPLILLFIFFIHCPLGLAFTPSSPLLISFT